MEYAYSTLIQDVILEYSYSDCSNMLGLEDFSPKHHEFQQRPSELVDPIQKYSLTLPILKLFPESTVWLTSPIFAEIGTLLKTFDHKVESIFSGKGSLGSDLHPTIIIGVTRCVIALISQPQKRPYFVFQPTPKVLLGQAL